MTEEALEAKVAVVERLQRLIRRIEASKGTEQDYDALYADIVKMAYRTQMWTHKTVATDDLP